MVLLLLMLHYWRIVPLFIVIRCNSAILLLYLKHSVFFSSLFFIEARAAPNCISVEINENSNSNAIVNCKQNELERERERMEESFESDFEARIRFGKLNTRK